MLMLAWYLPKLQVVTPFAVDPLYESWPGSLVILNMPPPAWSMTPAWTAASQAQESNVYGPVSHTDPDDLQSLPLQN